MGAVFGDPPPVEADDRVREPDRGEPVGYDDDGLPGGRGPNGLDELGYHYERFIVEIPVTISSSTELTDVKLKAGKIEVTEGNLYGHMWLHLDSDNDYRLLNGDDTTFVGFINQSTDQVYEDTTDGYTEDYTLKQKLDEIISKVDFHKQIDLSHLKQSKYVVG